MQLTVYFDGQFWVGAVEQYIDDSLLVYRYLFGPEPTDGQIVNLTLSIQPTIFADHPGKHSLAGYAQPRTNPKRLARKVAQEMQQRGISTRAQLALQAQHETCKKEQSEINREQKQLEKDRKRELATAKAKAKHRGH